MARTSLDSSRLYYRDGKGKGKAWQTADNAGPTVKDVRDDQCIELYADVPLPGGKTGEICLSISRADFKLVFESMLKAGG